MTGHPDWNKVMADCGGARADDNDLVRVTRGTLRLAAAALRRQRAAECCHNDLAAELEIFNALGGDPFAVAYRRA